MTTSTSGVSGSTAAAYAASTSKAADASRATSTGGRSAAGEALQRFPPTVARFRMPGDPM